MGSDISHCAPFAYVCLEVCVQLGFPNMSVLQPSFDVVFSMLLNAKLPKFGDRDYRSCSVQRAARRKDFPSFLVEVFVFVLKHAETLLLTILPYIVANALKPLEPLVVGLFESKQFVLVHIFGLEPLVAYIAQAK